MFPLAGLAVFVGTTCGLFTVVVTSFVWLLSTVAWFVIVLVYTPVLNPFTVTSKLKVVCPLAGTFTVIPLLKSNCVDDGCPDILPGTNVVPSGISSLITTFFSKSPSFLTIMLYVIFSPSKL